MGVAVGGGGIVGVVVSAVEVWQVVDAGRCSAVGGHTRGWGDHSQGPVETCKY